MRFLRDVKGCNGLNKLRSEDILKELNASSVQEIKSKYKQNWIDHLKGTDDSRLPKRALYYKPTRRRDHRRPQNQWRYYDVRTGYMP
jgi:hypothetical protein